MRGLLQIGGRYRIQKEVGRGGMGVVYAATDLRSEADVALKLLERASATPTLERRFRREFHTLANLAHPRIVRAHDYGVDTRGPYYTMDLLDGSDLDGIGRLEVEPACRILRDVSSSLAFLHARQLIHRDVKLKNVRLTALGDAMLMDFGLLATSGITPEDVVGTPSYMAPECLRMGVLDHRVDLFSLGVFAYRLLTGRPPFAFASSFVDLEDCWQATPVTPSALAPGIPAALDALVLSLLCINPLGRPSSAAEVIDRVTSIGSLERVPELETARGYLASAALVGRDGEMKRLRARMTKAFEGGSQSATIEASSGEGKSRLLRELVIEAQLAGATAIAIDCDVAGRSPYGALRKLAEALHSSDAIGTLGAASKRISVIGRALPEIRERLGNVKREETTGGDPAEERLQLQSELTAFVLEAVGKRKAPVAILLDDAQRCDEGSAVALASVIARATSEKLFLVCAVRTDENARAQDAIDAIRGHAERVILSGLSELETRAFVDASFGAVPNAARFARSLHVASGGSPIQLTELLRDLVDSNVIRYDAGLWHLPDEIELAMPQSLAGAMDARVAALEPKAARELASALAAHGGRLTIEMCVAVSNASETETLDLTKVLVDAGFLAFADDVYEIRHDGFREALLRAMSAEEKKRVHLRVGRAIQKLEKEAVASADIGWHLLEGGEELEGAALLESSGLVAFNTQSFDDAIRMLEAALEVYETQNVGGSPAAYEKKCLELRQILVACGMQCSKTAVDRHAGKVIDVLEEAGGIHTLRRMLTIKSVPFVIAFLLSMIRAWARYLFGGSKRTPNPITALSGYLTTVTYLGTALAVAGDFEGARDAAARLEVFERLEGRLPYAALLLARSFHSCAIGAWETARADLETVLSIFKRDRLTPLRAIDRRMGQGGAKFAIASLYSQDQQPKTLVWLAEIDDLHLRFFGAGAKAARVQFHRLRGEETLAAEVEREMDLELLQGGSLWILETQTQWLSSLAYAYTHDVVGMRRSIERLEVLCAKGMRYESILELVRAEHLRETGEGIAVRAHLERCLATLPEEELRVREQALLAMAGLSLSEGDYEGCERWAKECLAVANRPECGRTTPRLLATRALALADAGRGDLKAALTRLEEVAAEVEALNSPMMHIEMLLARAQIARWSSEPKTAEEHLAKAKEWAEQAKNPSLAARVLLASASSSRLPNHGSDRVEATKESSASDDQSTVVAVVNKAD